MTREEVKKTVHDAIIKVVDVQPQDIIMPGDDDNLYDWGLDSLDMLELVMNIEKEHQITIADDEVDYSGKRAVTVNLITDVIMTKL